MQAEQVTISVGAAVPKKISSNSKRWLAAGVAVLLVGVIALAVALPLTLVSQGDDDGLLTSVGTGEPQYDPDDCEYQTGSECDISFGPDPLQKLDLYKTAVASPMGYVLYVHGGGWSGGDKSTNTNPPWWLLDLRQRGYHVASTNYRLAPKDLDAASPSTFHHPAQIEDVESAVKYLKQHAVANSLEPRKIVAIGNSAGGHLVSLLGTRNGPGSDARVAGVINLYGGAALYGAQADARPIHNLLGCNTSSVPNTTCYTAALDASPDQHIAADNPPFFIFHGEDDMVVPVNGSKIFQAELESAGVNSTLVIVPGVEHDKDRVACSQTNGLVNTEHIYDWIRAILSPGAPCGLGCAGGTTYGDGTINATCLRNSAAAVLD